MDESIFKKPLSYENDFEILSFIGRGQFGDVFKVRYKGDGKIYALKKYEKKILEEKHIKPQDYYRETKILYYLDKMNCINIVKLYADFEDDTSKNLVMELVEGKTLKSLCTETNEYIPQNQIINIFTQLLKTLQFLHGECHILHRDIKPDNIILQNNNIVKLMDFGISVYLEHSDEQLLSRKSRRGFPPFLPDELLMYKVPKYDYKLDIFSLGFTMYSLMNPSTTEDYNLPLKTKQVLGSFQREVQYLHNDHYPTWLRNLVAMLYEKNQKKRPTAGEALKLLQDFQSNSNLNQNSNNNKPNINNINIIYKREDSGLTPINNINNQIFNQIPILNPMSSSARQISKIPDPDMTTNTFNKDMKRINSLNPPKNNEKVEEPYLGPEIEKNNRIMTSMKSLLQIIYRLDVMNNIQKQLNSIIYNSQINNVHYFINTFQMMLINTQQFDNGNIDQVMYDQNINEFIDQVFINNKSDVSGTRPIILFQMISSIFKYEFNQYFNFYQNYIFDNMMQNNYLIFNLNKIIKMNNEIYNGIINNILDFKNKYKGPFVDNFYFLLFKESKCTNCQNLFGFKINASHVLQLDVKNPNNNISDLINNFFSPKISNEIFKCKTCGFNVQKSRRLYCLNLPNYLILELEDRNSVKFDDKIIIQLFDGSMWSYQYLSGIYKFKNIDVSDFVAVFKKNNNYYFYSDDKVEQCPPEFINLECPSMVIYKKVS